MSQAHDQTEQAPAPLAMDSIARHSAELGDLFAALSLAQGELTDPAKNKRASVKMKSGGEYGYKYSDLADLLQIVRPVFARHGLCLIQFPINKHRGAVTIVTMIGHKSGQWIEGDLTMPVEDERPQTLGSMITYGRRYSAGGVAGVSPDEDEDGQIGQDASGGRQQKAAGKTQGGDRAARPQQVQPKASPPPTNTTTSQSSTPKATPGNGEAEQATARTASIYNDDDPEMQKTLAGLLQAQKVHPDLWSDIGKRLHNLPSTELKRVIADAKAEAGAAL
jgi:hypothetical protein